MSSEGELYEQLQAYCAGRPAVNTHCHILPEPGFQDFDLDKLLRNSYLNWCGLDWQDSQASRQAFFQQVRNRSVFAWLQKALQELYSTSQPLSAECWQDWSERISAAHDQPGYRQSVLRERCAYRQLVLDAYWQPGSDNQQPELFSPTFRVNSFFFGYAQTETDHDGSNPYRQYPRSFILELDEYVAWLRKMVRQKQAEGCVAIKIPIAYDRGLDFGQVRRERAAQAFARMTRTAADSDRALEAKLLERSFASTDSIPSNAPATGSRRAAELGLEPEDVKDFQDYLFFQVCRMAAEFQLPVQVHTGSGQGRRTNALQLLEAILSNPDTQFVLLHCSYPWVQDTAYLVGRFPNVYADLSMLPLFSSQAAREVLDELIESANLDRLAWGCDTWTPEESFGALLAFRHVLAKCLADRISDGYLDRPAAEAMIEAVLLQNAEKLYGLETGTQLKAGTGITSPRDRTGQAP